MEKELLSSEFDRQLEVLIQKGYPKATGITEQDFIGKVSALKPQLMGQSDLYDIDYELGKLPFAIVVSSRLVPIEFAMNNVQREGVEGIVKLFPHEPKDFNTISEVVLPELDIYLILNIDRGKQSINLAPAQAMTLIKQESRSPLTIDEGVAIVTQFPDFLMKNNCFSLLASRHEGDKRVPAIWINAKKQPNLGWCWDGNPHTWLGSASCEKRVG